MDLDGPPVQVLMTSSWVTHWPPVRRYPVVGRQRRGVAARWGDAVPNRVMYQLRTVVDLVGAHTKIGSSPGGLLPTAPCRCGQSSGDDPLGFGAAPRARRHTGRPLHDEGVPRGGKA